MVNGSISFMVIGLSPSDPGFGPRFASLLKAFNSLWSRCRTAVEWKYHITKVVLVMFNGRVTVTVKVVMVTVTGTVQ